MTTKTIDCLFIGHNEMNFDQYEGTVRKMGVNSGAYRDLSKNFLQYDNKNYIMPDFFNLFSQDPSLTLSDYPPLTLGENFSGAIAYLGTYLQRRGFSFDFINAFQEQKEALAKKLTEANILTVAIITTLYVAAFPIMEIVEFVRRYDKTVKIVIGGPFVTTQVNALEPVELDYLLKNIDADIYIKSFQGEATLVKLLEALKNNRPLDTIDNLYFRNGEGYTVTPQVTENNILAENMVDWDLFGNRTGTYVNLRTGISCPFSCSFCAFPQHAGKYQAVSVELIERELDALKRTGKSPCLFFIDDTFNVPIKRFKDVLRMMIKNKYNFQWYSHLRCQFADKEMLDLMKESGCIGVFLGIESANDGILKNMNKAVTVDKYWRGVRLLKEAGIVTHGSFIIGFPGETLQSVEDSKRFIRESGLDFFRAQLWYCEPITPIWKQKDTFKIQGSHYEWSHATMDSGTAGDLVDGIFLDIQQPTWVPQYNFEFSSVIHLIHRGMTKEEAASLISLFNAGVREKFLNRDRREVSPEVINRVKSTFRKAGVQESPAIQQETLIDRDSVSFDF